MKPADHHDTSGVGLEIRNLRKTYEGQLVLKGVSIRVERGEVFVIMGPSGSGKSVLLKHLIGLEEPDEGEILIEGDSIHHPSVREQYRLAIVFQSGALLNSLTVGENVGLYLSEHRLKSPEEIKAIVASRLDLVGLKGMEDRSPSELSGGMKKRVAIARALVVEPHLIFYDEPTSELDPLMAATIGREIAFLNERTKVTSVVVTHDRVLGFGIADRIAIIHEGRILKIGSPAEIKGDPDPFIQEFINAEFKTLNPTEPL